MFIWMRWIGLAGITTGLSRSGNISPVKKNADIVCLDNEALFDSRKFKMMGDLGKLLEDQFLSMLAYVAEQERKKNMQRQAEGIEVARTAGVTFGRPKKKIDETFIQAYKEWKAGRITATAAIQQSGLTKPTFYRRVKEYEAAVAK
ncbi:transposon Tn552 DNA-invertase binR (plasmid) [Paenibacillus polymyxa M1]|nr:transposon Tn552 DNA-invertase binR [Paenibacillus polymyxa M1]